ncbi:hypothetical protein WBJ53_12975 [Spirosoma sp. SC4-14]|uniref:hypothetical protein n=1 Tax=Spirosoma sp. SC4-14 TaxID=3128900 RepID=UPI0030CDF7C5
MQQSMPMVPTDQKKRQAGSLINKINFSVCRLLIDNLTNPVLPKQQEIQSQMNNVAFQATIKPNYIDGRKWRAESLKQNPIEPLPNRSNWLIDMSF